MLLSFIITLEGRTNAGRSYSLWANVRSRVEYCWDRVDGKVFDATSTGALHIECFLLAAQLSISSNLV